MIRKIFGTPVVGCEVPVKRDTIPGFPRQPPVRDVDQLLHEGPQLCEGIEAGGKTDVLGGNGQNAWDSAG